MMRSALLWASTNPFLAQKLPRMKFVQVAARRFMPGEAPEDALQQAAVLRQKGSGVLITALGENIETLEEARQVVDHYLALMDDARSKGVGIEISVKPTQLGLDQSAASAVENLSELVAAAQGDTVWIDMESTPYVDPTLDLYRAVKERHPNVGICLQAYLRRTPDDLEALLPIKPSIRLVKGAYREPAELAFPKKSDVDAAYMKLSSRMLQQASVGQMGRVGVGTHDERMINHAKTRAHELGLDGSSWEVEMLYGISVGVQDQLLKGGTPLSVLISYGQHWFPWYMRRLAERPANVWFVARKMVGL